MAVKRIIALVEGPTEEAFCNQLLSGYLWESGEIELSARIVRTSPGHKGGINGYGKAKWQIQHLCSEQRGAWVTTMFDLFKMPTDFPGYAAAQVLADPYQRVDHLERALSNDIQRANFAPYLQLHEFEALVFADVALAFGNHPFFSESIPALQAVRANYASPEHINTGYAPSYHLLDKLRSAGYGKLKDSPSAAAAAGMQVLRGQCRHFDTWISRLHALPVR